MRTFPNGIPPASRTCSPCSMCAPRLYCPQSAVEPPLHTGRRRPRLLAPSPRTVCPPFGSRQSASAFNQPLSFDTSSVTDMQQMFRVRSTPVLPPICSRASTAHWTPSPPSTGPHPRPAHHMPSVRLSAGRVVVGVQPAAGLRHVQRHEHALHVRGALHACSVPNLQSSLHCTLDAVTPSAGPHPRPAPYAPLSALGRARRRSTSR